MQALFPRLDIAYITLRVDEFQLMLEAARAEGTAPSTVRDLIMECELAVKDHACSLNPIIEV